MIITGKVIHGAGQAGSTFGVSTANLDLDSAAIEDGVYVATLESDGVLHEAIAYLGIAHLVEGQPWHCEVHILEGEYDLYGKDVEVELKQRLRGSIKFTTEEQAQTQINQDITQAKAYFS